MLVPVTVIRVDGVRQWDGSTAAGRQAECSHCGRCKLTADDGKTATGAAKHAITELARTCEGQGVHRYYRDRLPAGVTLHYQFRDEWRPAHWIQNRVCGLSGDVSVLCPVKVVAAAGPTPRATAKAARDAERLAARIRRTWKDVTVERPELAPVEAKA